MIYSRIKRLCRSGIPFEASELAPINLERGSICWGLWVEGRGGVDRCRFADSLNLTEVQAPHLVVSGIHPDLWPTTFTIQALLERSSWQNPAQPFQGDAIYGLTNALAHCDINILVAQTAQAGYDLEVFNAVCELPGLRSLTGDILANLSSRLKEIDAKGGASITKLRNDARINAFEAIGRVMIDRLATLQARLGVINHLRATIAGSPGAAAAFATHPERKRLLDVVTPRSKPGDEQVLNAPAFFNGKILQDGGNSFFLSRDEVAAAPPEQWPFRYASDKRDVADNPPRPDDRNSRSLWDAYLQVLKGRKSSEPIRARHTNHEMASLLRGVSSGDELRALATSRFFERQSLLPARILSLPSLAYARIWAFTSQSPLVFSLEPGVLCPIDPHDEVTPLGVRPIVSVLNELTGCSAYEPGLQFDLDAVAMCSIHVRDRFLRVRFLRRSFAAQHCARLVVRFRASKESKDDPTGTKGLLQTILGVLTLRGLRVERSENRFTRMTDREERGVISVLLKSTCNDATAALADEAGRNHICKEVKDAILSVFTNSFDLDGEPVLFLDAVDA